MSGLSYFRVLNLTIPLKTYFYEVLNLKISTKGRYALRVMAQLAKNDSENYTPLKEIAEEEKISLKYLEGIMTTLSKAGFLDAVHGKGGGYKLSKSPKDYTVGSILKLTEKTLCPVACLESENEHCKKADSCLTQPLWSKLNKVIDDFLENVTLEDLINKNL